MRKMIVGVIILSSLLFSGCADIYTTDTKLKVEIEKVDGNDSIPPKLGNGYGVKIDFTDKTQP